MSGNDKILGLQKEKAYLAAQLEEAAKELSRLDLRNLILTQQKKQAFAAFNFIKIMQEKIESAFTISDLYSNVVKAITDDLCMNSAALLKINRATRDISILSSSGLPENIRSLNLDESIPDQEVFKPTFVNSKSSLQVFHRFVINSFKHPFFLWYPIEDDADGALVLFAGNTFEDLMSKQPFSEASLEAFGAISSVILLRKDNIVRTIEVLRRKEERIDFLAEILRASPIAVLATDWNAKITYVNPAMEKLYGYKPEELMGKDPGILNAEMNAPEIQENIVNTVKQGKVWRGEVVNKKKDGELFYMHGSIYPVHDKEGNFIAFVGFQEDITKSKQAEHALQASERKYRYLVDNAPVGIYRSNLEGDVFFVNEALCRMLEFNSPEEVMAGNVLTIYEKQENRKALIGLLKEKNTVENFEVKMITKTGKIKDVLISASLDGDIISGMIVDITERKQAENALKLYREIFYHSDDGIAIINPQGFYLEQNPAHRELIGYSCEDLKGKTPAIHLGDKTFSEIIEEQTKKGGYHGELTSYSKLGEKKDIELSSFSITNEKGEVNCYVGIKRDITERKRIQEQLQSLSRRLMEVQESDRRFLASELHDQIGQNLTALSINLNIINSQFSERADKNILDRLKDSLKLVEETIERMRNVIAGLRPPVLEDYGLGVALRWYIERFSERTGVLTLLQEKEFSSRLPLAVETTLFRIVQEVLTNVAKHAQARQVDIILERMDGLIQLSISDDGVGFDPEALRQFKKQPGWGLITIEERAKALGGDVCMKSTPGGGAQVIVQLPC